MATQICVLKITSMNFCRYRKMNKRRQAVCTWDGICEHCKDEEPLVERLLNEYNAVIKKVVQL